MRNRPPPRHDPLRHPGFAAGADRPDDFLAVIAASVQAGASDYWIAGDVARVPCDERARRAGQWSLAVSADNGPVLALYRSTGFEGAG